MKLSWTNNPSGDLLDRAGDLLALLSLLIAESGRPGQQLELPAREANGLCFILEHIREVVAQAQANTRL